MMLTVSPTSRQGSRRRCCRCCPACHPDHRILNTRRTQGRRMVTLKVRHGAARPGGPKLEAEGPRRGWSSWAGGS